LIWGLIKFFTSKEIQETVETTGFKQRDSKLRPDTFFKAFKVGLWSLHEVTLTALVGQCEDLQPLLKLSRQGCLLIAILQVASLNKNSLKDLFIDVVQKSKVIQKSKLKKRKRKTT
jgi:hypothetical protein